MALICRLNLKQIFSLYRSAFPQLVKSANKPWGGVSAFQTSTIKYDEDHDDRNMRLGRPQSPHLTIYAPQLTSMLSITHRLTGAALASYVMVLGTGFLFVDDWESLIRTMECWHLPPTVWLGVKSIIAFPFAFHFCNGIRHLSWDIGKFLTIKEVYTTGYIMIACSGLMTAALLML